MRITNLFFIPKRIECAVTKPGPSVLQILSTLQQKTHALVFNDVLTNLFTMSTRQEKIIDMAENKPEQKRTANSFVPKRPIEFIIRVILAKKFLLCDGICVRAFKLFYLGPIVYSN